MENQILQDNVVEQIQSDIGIDIARVSEQSQKKYDEELEQHLNYNLGEEEPVIQQPAEPEMMEPEFQEIPLTTEQIQERSTLLNYIKLAKQHFPNDWNAMGVSDELVMDSDIEQLRLIVDDYKFRRDSTASFDSMVALANRAILLAEGLGVSFGLELGGLSKRLEQNEDYNEALKAVIHDKGNKLRLTPIQRLCVAIASTAYITHTENVAAKKMNQIPTSDESTKSTTIKHKSF